jgi:hypothetical protein
MFSGAGLATITTKQIWYFFRAVPAQLIFVYLDYREQPYLLQPSAQEVEELLEQMTVSNATRYRPAAACSQPVQKVKLSHVM